MERHKLKPGTFMGETINKRSLNGFTLSVTEHSHQMKVPNHEHEFPYISLCLKGYYHESSCISKQDILPGHALFRPKGYEHKNEIGIHQSFCFNIEIQKDLFQEKLSLVKDAYFTIDSHNLELMKIYFAYQKGESDELLDLNVEENTYHIFGNQLKGKFSGRALWINKIKSIVKENPGAAYSIDTVSELLHIHPIYFVRKFKEVTGFTFGEFLLRQRICNTIQLMLNSKKALTEIALDSGFYDQSHFIRHFKNAFKVSPSKFRKIVKG